MAKNTEYMGPWTIDEVKRINSSYGPSELMRQLNDKLNHWKSQPLNIAIIGNSGTGKSSYINAIRGLDGDDEGAAAVGETETTIGDPISYKDPRNSNLLYWDLPGVGTPKYPKETYLRQVGFDKFDFYILISSQRFTQNDLWLAMEIEKAGKNFFFLRSKIDNALNDEKRAHKQTYNQKATLDKIRKNCEDSLRMGKISTVNIFLMSSYQPALFDFNKAKEKLLQDYPRLKKHALVLSVSQGQSKLILKTKIETLRERIEMVSIASSVSNVVPIPGLGFVCDIALVHFEANFYAKQLALDDTSLKDLARDADVTEDSLKDKRHLYCAKEIFTKIKERKGKVMTYLSFVPLVGSIANIEAASIVREFLDDILNDYEEAAMKILEYTQPRVARNAAEKMDL